MPGFYNLNEPRGSRLGHLPCSLLIAKAAQPLTTGALQCRGLHVESGLGEMTRSCMGRDQFPNKPHNSHYTTPDP